MDAAISQKNENFTISNSFSALKLKENSHNFVKVTYAPLNFTRL